MKIDEKNSKVERNHYSIHMLSTVSVGFTYSKTPVSCWIRFNHLDDAYDFSLSINRKSHGVLHDQLIKRTMIGSSDVIRAVDWILIVR